MKELNWSNILEVKDNFLKSAMSKFRFTIVIDLLVKTLIFMALIEVREGNKVELQYINFKFSLIYLAIILIFYSFGYLLSNNKQIVYNMLLNLFYSLFLIIDLWYFRINKDFLGIKNLIYKGTFNPMGKSLFQFKPIDLIFVIDIVAILIIISVKKIRNTEKRDKNKFGCTILTSVAIISIAYLFTDVFEVFGNGNKIFTRGLSHIMSARPSGPVGYTLIDGVRTLLKFSEVNSSEEKEIEAWINENNEELDDNKYMGINKGKNIIFLQLESFENMVINKTANGKELTPFLNKLASKGLYFNNIYEQNNGGGSIDCDFMVNTSIYPLGHKVTALDYGEDTFKDSLPRILNRNGYMTISSHAEDGGEFNWAELHKNSLGVQELWGLSDYIYEEKVGYGLSDRSFLSQLAYKIKDLKEPFFLQAVTLSSHGPFDIGKQYRELNLPEEIDDNYLGGYFESVRYTDHQIEMFFNKLEQYGLLDDTMIVLYGDHTGVHKYYNDDIENLDFEGNWWKEGDRKIPLIIYSKDMESQVIETPGGQVDIMPTVLYLLGINKEEYVTAMGVNLLNTNRSSTVIDGGSCIKGNPSTSEEKEHLLKAYDIGKMIIENNYYRED